MDRRFVGKSAIVTGAGSGIGRAVAQRLAAEGATVTCMDLNDSVHATVASIVAEGGTARAGVADVTDFGAVESAVNAAASAQSGIHVVCNVAGIGHFARSEREDPARFARVIAVNLTGSFHVARAALPAMIAGGGGVIVNTASNAGINGQPWSAAYCASKAGLIGMARAIALDHGARGLRVTCLCRGATDTPMLWRGVDDRAAEEASLVARMPLRRIGRPDHGSHRERLQR